MSQVTVRAPAIAAAGDVTWQENRGGIASPCCLLHDELFGDSKSIGIRHPKIRSFAVIHEAALTMLTEMVSNSELGVCNVT